MTPPGRWWRPDLHADRRPFLTARGKIASAVRAYFGREDFVEVECSALQVSPGNETHLHAFATAEHAPGAAPAPLYLHTSPEFACKKLLAAGESRIFDLARVYRDREAGPLHAREFTMLEWYRAGAPYEDVQRDCVELARAALEAIGEQELRWAGKRADPFLEPQRITIAEAFAAHAGIDILALLDDRDALAAQARGLSVNVAGDDDWGDLFSRILVEKIEPFMGQGRLTILCEYPLSEAALARASVRDPRVAERFELYACGVELANCFAELTDAAEQRRRFAAAMDEKQRRYGERYPIDEDFLAALALMPAASGGALGFERLVMLASGARRIEDVQWTPP